MSLNVSPAVINDEVGVAITVDNLTVFLTADEWDELTEAGDVALATDLALLDGDDYHDERGDMERGA